VEDILIVYHDRAMLTGKLALVDASGPAGTLANEDGPPPWQSGRTSDLEK
jgi:hypothetical protein